MTEQQRRSLFFSATGKVATLNPFEYFIFCKGMDVEREACAALCFRMWNEWLDSSVGDDFLDTSNCPDAEDCAAAIRARGQE